MLADTHKETRTRSHTHTLAPTCELAHVSGTNPHACTYYSCRHPRTDAHRAYTNTHTHAVTVFGIFYYWIDLFKNAFK